ncbi:MAG TPA: hypothetical protein VNQ90_02185 [Chthoniobacteraceae bacterium]|nr:hypothetical protein [Chthoniobacteraceae bacterium]
MKLASVLMAAVICINGFVMGQEIPSELEQSWHTVSIEYPDAFKEGSPLAQAASKEVERLKSENSPLLNNPNYPLIIARYVAAQLGIAPATQQQAEVVSPVNTDTIQFVVATREENDVRFTGTGKWKLEIGETFPFVRHMSVSEYNGGVPDHQDKTYSVLKMDDSILVVHSSNLALVPESDLSKAAMTHQAIVQASRKHDARVNREQKAPPYRIIQGSGPVRPGTVYRDSSGHVAQSLEPGRVYHRRAVSDAEEAQLIRISQAMERGASDAELSQLEATEEMRRSSAELQQQLQRLRWDIRRQSREIDRLRNQ